MEKKETETLEEKNFESEIVYDGFHKIEKITRKSGEKEISGEVFKKNETITVIVYNTKTKKYIFIERYRLAANGRLVEAIQGEVEKDEKPQQTTKRLVTELTGYKVDDSRILSSYFIDPNNSSEISSLYYVEVSEKVVDDLDYEDYKLVDVEKLGLGGKLFIEDPVNMMNMDLNKEKEKKVIPPYQVIDVKTLIAVMWVENHNLLKEMAETLTNAKIRSL